MKAVVMAGGEGTRLRPMTANQPKPMLPVVNRPIMEHVLRLLRQHGLTETVVTVQFLASMVRNYFGDGEDFGMSLQYATEEMPLGTAGSVKNAEDALRDEPFLVISGDALTDIDLSDLIALPQGQRRAGDGRAGPGARSAGVRHRDRRRRRPDPAVPGEADLGPGVLRHRQHRHLRDGARGARARAARRGGGLVRRRVPQAAGERRAAVRLDRRRLLGGRRLARELPQGAGGRADRQGQRGDRRIRGVARRLGGRRRRGRPGGRAAPGRCASASTPRSRPAPSCASSPSWAAT